jgi:hypothetical protein
MLAPLYFWSFVGRFSSDALWANTGTAKAKEKGAGREY